MWKWVNKVPYLNKRIANTQNKGQALVEFAMISMLLFLLLIGIMEMGRMMFVWTQLASAAQEGTRYGLTHPREIISSVADPPPSTYPDVAHNPDPCNIVAQARERVVLVPHNDVGVEVGYDDAHGVPAAPVYPFQPGGIDFHPTEWRVVVTTTYQFHFMVGIFDNILPAAGLRLQMVSARTIQVNETGTPVPGAQSDCGTQ